ncbi:hypothetical protein QQS21_002471 [Conoideocrella luteorostrata]|uniref:non-specific serine/threonine protein kinase n=1 Tax=Conoideocrella luteorostrata TaxID=1105319 RepID=A0AAJ0G2X2_9HYPO|nr:hypothetical protein QQS21_002471 [Conoideocrella luteorostrata]
MPDPQPEVISADASSRSDSYFRIKVGSRVNWTVAHVEKKMGSDTLEATLANTTFAGVKGLWSSSRVDCLSLERTFDFNFMTYECVPVGKDTPRQVAKIARFEWEIPYITHETEVYRHLEGSDIARRFLGHLFENGRPMGFLLEYVEGQFAGIHDLDKCKAVLERFHQLGWVHGDVNRYNFIINNDRACLIDFGNSQKSDCAEKMATEMMALSDKLRDESRLGAPFGAYEDGDDGETSSNDDEQ